MRKVIDFLDLKTADDVTILQEVPYHSGLYELLHSEFADLEILTPRYVQDYAAQCTVAACTKNSNWSEEKKPKFKYVQNKNRTLDYGNKFIELNYKYTDLTVLGVHMPCVQSAWNGLFETIERADFFILVGDFNAHENEHRKDHRSKNLPRLREYGYKDAVPNGAVTYYPAKTTIDHLYYQEGRETLKKAALTVTQTEYSDHAALRYDFTPTRMSRRTKTTGKNPERSIPMIYTSEYLSPIGQLLLAEKEGALIGLWKKGQKYYGSTLKGETAERPDSPTLLRTKQWLDRYFGKENPAIEDLPLAPEGSDFRKAVWNILRTVPYGETTTYGEIARKLAAKQGSDRVSARAVGNAIGHNPILIILPCHRVIGTNGNLTGYAGGIETKIRLLTLEGIDATQFKAPKKNVKP